MENNAGKSILIGHTDADYLEELTHYLDYSGCISHAANGMQALENILTTRPDLIIVERGFPLLNGKDIARIVRKKRIRAQFIFIYNCQEEANLFQDDREIAQGSILKYHSFEPSIECIKSILSGIPNHPMGINSVPKGLSLPISILNSTNDRYTKTN